MKKRFNPALILLRWLYQKRGFIMRAFVCWAFSLFFLKFDQVGNYDIRFNLRASQKVSQEIVLITLKASDISKMYDLKTNAILKATELADLSDSFFWDKSVWNKLIQTILKQNPKKIGVTMYFGNNIGNVQLTNNETNVLVNPKIVWATNSNEAERLSLPITALGDKTNIAHIETLKDDDGVVRRILNSTDTLPNLAEKLAQNKFETTDSLSIINYKGKSVFTEITFAETMSGQLPDHFFENKIVLIGSEVSSYSQIQTPIGVMSRHEYWASVTENYLSNSFIKKVSGFWYSLFLLGLTVLSVWIITTYPLAVALFFIIWLATLTSAFSSWAFDSLSIWIPIMSPLSLFVIVWVLFIGYQALRIEQAHIKLQQQQNYLAELEQLKNNFVSLISHDLKTPIAKIQGVIDRLLAVHKVNSELHVDLYNLREYSDELNRYIQSILKVLRVESRDFKIMKETADLNGVIENVIEKLSPLALTKKISLQTELEPMFLIEIDVTLMTEVFLNIIENAIKYTPSNGFVRIKSYETAQEIYISITDSGEGITVDDQEIIWDKFTRGKSQDYKTKGSGLGLYLVKYFVELHGGKITMQSEVNKGTQFIVSLPIEQSH